MILPWMAYSILVAFLFGLAAVGVEGPMRERGWSIRRVWLGALTASATLPLVGAFLLPRLAALRTEAVRMPALEVQASTGAGWLDPLSADRAALPDLDPWLTGFWLAASATLAAALLASWIRLRLREREWKRGIVDGKTVWVSSDMGPAVVGFVRSRIVLPAWVLDRSPDERALVLAHEEEHLRAGDPRVILAALLLLCAAPWNPALWWQLKRLRQAVEIDCDLRVVSRGLDRQVYSRLLLAVGEQGGSHRLAVAALIESRSLLEKRIRIMLNPTQTSGRLRVAGSIALAAVCIFAACRADRPASTPITGTGEAVGDVVPTKMVVGRTYQLAELDHPPKLINQTDIAATMERLYPKVLQDAGIGGTVVTQFDIAADGSPDTTTIKVLSSDREELSSASTEAIEMFRFTPAQYRGESVRVQIQMPITWQPRRTMVANRSAAETRAAEEANARARARVPDPATADRGAAPAQAAQAPSFAYELGVLDRVPQLSNQSTIAAVMERLYPRLLQDAGIRGTVVIQFVIQPDGIPDMESARVLESPHPQLADASLRALERFRFRPGVYRGENVRVLIQMPITWQPISGSPAAATDSRETGVVTGRVVDAGGKAITGARVAQANSDRGAVTDADGRFVLRLPEGMHPLIAFLADDPSQVRQTVVVRAGGTAQVDFRIP